MLPFTSRALRAQVAQTVTIHLGDQCMSKYGGWAFFARYWTVPLTGGKWGSGRWETPYAKLNNYQNLENDSERCINFNGDWTYNVQGQMTMKFKKGEWYSCRLGKATLVDGIVEVRQQKCHEDVAAAPACKVNNAPGQVGWANGVCSFSFFGSFDGPDGVYLVHVDACSV